MHRFWIWQEDFKLPLAYIKAEEAAHAAGVLRLKAGDAIELVVEKNGRFEAVLESVDKRGGVARVGEKLEDHEPDLRVTLYQGIPKGEKMESIIQKCVELGVHAIQPVRMSRCVVKMDEKDARKKTERWQRVAREAVKQCGRGFVPEVLLPCAVADIPAESLLLVPWECEAAPFGAALEGASCETGVGIVIGPEGGITHEEIGLLRQKGAKTVSLGPRILRTETAGPAALAALMFHFGQWKGDDAQ